MSAADVGVGGPPAPRWGVARVARLQALATRLRSAMGRLLDPDDSALAAWAAAFARAPQAVPDLPPPPNKRLTRFVLGFVVGAHAAMLLALWWRAAPPPPPQTETTVELVREIPDAAKPKPPEAKPAPKPPQPPVQEGTSAEHKETARQQAKQEQQAQAEQHKAEQHKAEQAKLEPKPEPRQPKPARQHQAHRAAPPREQPQQQLQEPPKPAQDQQAQQQPAHASSLPSHDVPPAMTPVALPGASADGTEAVSYQQLVLSQVAKAKKQGRYMGVPGYAGVRFRVAEDGSLEMVKLVVSSGDPNLDIEAEAMIRRAAPFPKPPPGGRRDYGITLVFAAQPAP